MKKLLVILGIMIIPIILFGVYHKVSSYQPNNMSVNIHYANGSVFVPLAEVGFIILDVSDPHDPQLLNTTFIEGNCRQIIAGNDKAYVLVNSSCVLIYDITEPSQPQFASQYLSTNYIESIATYGNLLYLAMGSSGVLALNTTNPYNPIENHITEISGDVISVSPKRDEAYAVCRNGMIYAIDESNPLYPILQFTYSLNQRVQQITCTDSYVYTLSNGDTHFINGYKIMDDNSLLLQDTITMQDSIGSFTCFGDMVYYTTRESILYCSHWSDSDSLKVDGFYQLSSQVNSIVSSDNLVYTAADNSGIQIIDMADAENNEILDTFESPQGTSSYAFADDYLIQSDPSSLHFLEYSQQDSSSYVGELQSLGNLHCMLANGHFLIGAIDYQGIYTIDISDVYHPQIISHYDINDKINCDLIQNGKLYVGTDFTGLYIFNISDSAHPAFTGRYITSSPFKHITISENCLYGAMGDYGVYVIDISNASQLYRLGTIRVSDSANDIAVYHNMAYIANGKLGIEIIDMTNPTHPEFENNILSHTVTTVNSLKLYQDTLLASDSFWNEIVFYNLSSYSNPEAYYKILWNLPTSEMYIFDDKLYTNNGKYGLNSFSLGQVTNNDDIMADVIDMKIFPNPFHETTSIQLNLKNNKETRHVQIYNIRGQLVKEYKKIGNRDNRIVWDGTNKLGQRVSSGVYLCRIKTMSGILTKKIMFIK